MNQIIKEKFGSQWDKEEPSTKLINIKSTIVKSILFKRESELDEMVENK